MILRPPVDGLAGETTALVITLTSAADNHSRLVTAGILVTAAVILGAEVWSCRVWNETVIWSYHRAGL